jgi:D-lactate dehydrogenase
MKPWKLFLNLLTSFHCPLNDNTKHMINKSSLLQMNNIMLINTSRGALINTTDIIEALKSGKVGYLGIDVYEQEELFFKICLKILFKTMIYND